MGNKCMNVYLNYLPWGCVAQDHRRGPDHIRIVLGSMGQERGEEVRGSDPVPRGAQHQQTDPADQVVHHPAASRAVNGKCLIGSTFFDLAAFCWREKRKRRRKLGYFSSPVKL